ncbi:hypothetical protein IV203_009690 [Nitzschia inconspicua]|uniref:Uncharacterized protein n=1 Tax=Nitzschia inconspicua TaxID=303405 RepID=A0A9K3KUP4_9STRA|nr:hypothetical protein IV203_009690 [Nitzschia inconspicua]
MVPQDMFAQASRGISHLDVDEDGETQYEPGAAATLKNSKPPGANGGRRYRSRNERTMDMMKAARKREALCSLCLKPGHRVVKCPKISEAKATLIGPDSQCGGSVCLGGRRHARGGTLSCILSSQQGCPVDFNKLHCQKEEEAHPVLPAETCTGAIETCVRLWYKPMRVG